MNHPKSHWDEGQGLQQLPSPGIQRYCSLNCGKGWLQHSKMYSFAGNVFVCSLAGSLLNVFCFVCCSCREGRSEEFGDGVALDAQGPLGWGWTGAWEETWEGEGNEMVGAGRVRRADPGAGGVLGGRAVAQTKKHVGWEEMASRCTKEGSD